jgi:hypothetical protein
VAWDEKILQSKLIFPSIVMKIIVQPIWWNFLSHGYRKIIFSSPDVFFQASVGKFHHGRLIIWGSFPPSK